MKAFLHCTPLITFIPEVIGKRVLGKGKEVSNL